MSIHATRPSRHLSYDELACHDRMRTPYPADLIQPVLLAKLAPAFEAVRAAVEEAVGHEVPLIILSAYRTPQYNALIGGEAQSYHTQGMALDVTAGAALPVLAFALIVAEVARRDRVIKGVGFYPDNGFVHFDVRPSTRIALWREVVTVVLGERKRVRLPWTGEGFE